MLTGAPGWVLLAAAIVLAPPPAAPPPAVPSRLRATTGERPPMPPRALQLLAAGAVAITSVVMLGMVWGCIAAAILAPAVAWWVRRLATRPRAAAPDRSLALTLDLIAAALRGGQPVPAALVLAAPAASAAVASVLAQVAGLLRLGAEPDEAWRPADYDPTLAQLAHVARRSSTSGIRLAGALELLATDLRAELRAAAESRAQRAGVLAMAPLGLCFLPAFVCLGVIPVVVGIARGMSGVVP